MCGTVRMARGLLAWAVEMSLTDSTAPNTVKPLCCVLHLLAQLPTSKPCHQSSVTSHQLLACTCLQVSKSFLAHVRNWRTDSTALNTAKPLCCALHRMAQLPTCEAYHQSSSLSLCMYATHIQLPQLLTQLGHLALHCISWPSCLQVSPVTTYTAFCCGYLHHMRCLAACNGPQVTAVSSVPDSL